eukprot:COSAG06_NODE_71_length_25945_cov_9.124468_8_plen_54_part_00
MKVWIEKIETFWLKLNKTEGPVSVAALATGHDGGASGAAAPCCSPPDYSWMAG